MSAFFHSIRWRVQAWHAFILLLAIAGCCLLAYRHGSYNQLDRTDKSLSRNERAVFRSLMQASQALAAAAAGLPEKETPVTMEQFTQYLRDRKVSLPPEVMQLFQGQDPGYAYFSIQDRDGTILLQSANAPDGLQFLPVPEKDLVEDTSTRGTRRELRRSGHHGIRTLIGQDITPELEQSQRFAQLLALSGLGVWMSGLLGGWWLAGRAMQPIQTISQTAQRIAGGNLQERITIDQNSSELGQLSRVLNQTFERLHAAFQRQQQFTADASHELRTPVTIQLVETQRILKRDRSPEEYREAIRICEQSARQMRQLIEALLLLARQETGAPAARLPCDLAVIAGETVTRLMPLAVDRGITIESNLLPAPCEGDPAALSILAANLISNGIHHNTPGGRLVLTTRTGGHQAVLTVQDHGPGIPPEDLPHVFERFYRADKVRTGSSSHTGLGLAIAKSVAENHGGSIQGRNEEAGGAVFTVALPASDRG